MTQYCAFCGAGNPTAPCQNCGRSGVTETVPSMEPCAYCGARPTWPVTLEFDGSQDVIYLCASCDDEETAVLEADGC